MSTELQRTVVIEMPDEMYRYLACLAEENGITAAQLIIGCTIANCMTAAADRHLLGEVVRLTELALACPDFPYTLVTAKITS